MADMYFKTKDGTNVAVVRDVPLGRGRQQTLYLMRRMTPSFVLTDEAEYTRLKAEIDKKKGTT